jgi:uncharacterized protein YecE (DUF72 family)
VGPFYPTGTPAAGFLEAYATQLRTVELDSTFYAVPSERTVDGWRRRTPAGFVFAAKFPQAITHVKMLADCRPETEAFLSAMRLLGDRLGPLLLQMPPEYHARMLPRLRDYLAALPTGLRYALEVRHPSWLLEPVRSELLALLRSHGLAICLVQHAYMPRLDEITAPYTYIRWLGRRQDIPDDDFGHIRIVRDAQLDSWSEQVRRYLARSVTVFGYFNNHYQGHSPASVRAFQARLAGAATPGDPPAA